MPLPLLIGAAAIAAASYGAKKGYDGYQKHSEADEIVNKAKQLYDSKRSDFDEQEKETMLVLNELGETKLKIGSKLSEFRVLANEFLKKLNQDRNSKIELDIPKHELQKIEDYTNTAVTVLGATLGAGAAGAAAGFAVYGGVMVLGAASTGTAISSLAGVAATNATLAAIGGGSLAAGGLGMAGGTAILGAAVASPVLAIAGWAYNSHGEEALRNAEKVSKEAGHAVRKIVRAMKHLRSTGVYVTRIQDATQSIYDQFDPYFHQLKDIDKLLQDARDQSLDVNESLSELSEEIMRIVENGFALAAILVNLMTTPIFKFKIINNKIVKNDEGIPEMEKDADGSMVLSGGQLDQALIDAQSSAKKIEAA